MKTDDPSLTLAEEVEQEVCISCLHPNSIGTHFCKQCGTPLSTFATTQPLEHCLACGDFFREALQPGRGHPAARLGVMVLLLIMVILIIGGFLPP